MIGLVMVPGNVSFFIRSRFPSPSSTLRPPVGWVSCGPDENRLFFHMIFILTWRTFTVCDVLKKVARELVKVYQLRSQLGLHQSPSMSLFTWRRSQLFRRCLDDASREGNPIITSHRAHAYSTSPTMTCSFPRDTTSLHRAPGRKVGPRGLVSSALLAFSLSDCSIKFVLAIVGTLAACPAPLSCRNGLLAIRSGLGSLDCDRIPAAAERHLKLTTGCSCPLAARRGILSTRTPSVVE